jgi:hypothetical protein
MGFLNRLLNKSDNLNSKDQSLDIPSPPNFSMEDIPPPPNYEQNIQQQPNFQGNNDIPPPPNYEQNTQQQPSFQVNNNLQYPNQNTQHSQNIQPKYEPEKENYQNQSQYSQNIQPKYEPEKENYQNQSQYSQEKFIEDENFRSEDLINEKRQQLLNSGEPIFTKVEDYKRIIDASNEIKERVKECESTLKRLNEVHLESDRVYNKWKEELLDLNKRLNYIDKVIFD